MVWEHWGEGELPLTLWKPGRSPLTPMRKSSRRKETLHRGGRMTDYRYKWKYKQLRLNIKENFFKVRTVENIAFGRLYLQFLLSPYILFLVNQILKTFLRNLVWSFVQKVKLKVSWSPFQFKFSFNCYCDYQRCWLDIWNASNPFQQGTGPDSLNIILCNVRSLLKILTSTGFTAGLSKSHLETENSDLGRECCFKVRYSCTDVSFELYFSDVRISWKYVKKLR